VFRNAARAAPSRVAVALGDGSLTFGELDRRSNQVARALERAGVKRGHRAVVSSAVCLDVVPVFAALAKLGAVFAPINPALRGAEASAVVGAADPHHVLEVDQLTAAARSEGDYDAAAPQLRERDPHVVFFTSGSSGHPKAAVLSHRVSFLRSHPGALLEPRGAMVCPYPLFHMGAWTIALQQWQARDCVVLVPSATAEAICDAAHRHAATRLNCIPAVWRRILDHPPAAEQLRALRFADTGTSATPVELLQSIARLAPGAQVRVFYGSTEAGSVASLEHADIERKPGSVGVPAPSVEVRVAPDGELWVRGPLLFDGYLGDSEATAAAFAGGFFRTGDLAELDGDGYLTIVGRTGETIRTGGESVAPGEVEAVLAEHPSVADVAVVGVPSDEWGEIVCAVVVPAPGQAEPTVEMLRMHCAGRLAPFKHPRQVVTVGEIPRTAATRQVQRRMILDQVSG
jgi:acyl-CoA synthetase (AMP-forming)/AMP-acid ligase II